MAQLTTSIATGYTTPRISTPQKWSGHGIWVNRITRNSCNISRIETCGCSSPMSLRRNLLHTLGHFMKNLGRPGQTRKVNHGLVEEHVFVRFLLEVSVKGFCKEKTHSV